MLRNIGQAYEAGVSPLGNTLPANGANGQIGALFINIEDIDHDPLRVIAASAINSNGAVTAWTALNRQYTEIQGEYGAFIVSADGSYNYVVNDNQTAFMSLFDGQSLSDQFKVLISDDQAQPVEQIISISINGRDEVAKPSIAIVSNDDRINRSERNEGVVLNGTAPGANSVQISWGNTSKLVPTADGRWSALFATTIDPNQSNPLLAIKSEIPNDWQDSTIRVTAFDSNGQTSKPTERSIVVDTILPTLPRANPITEDRIININEKNSGVIITGSGEVSSKINLYWGLLSKNTIVDSAGNWAIRLSPTEIPLDNPRFSFLLTSTDIAGNVSLTTRDWVRIDTVAPLPATFNTITSDGIINRTEYSTGIELNGQVERDCSIKLSWGKYSYQPLVQANGRWSQWVSPEHLANITQNTPITGSVSDDSGNQIALEPIFPQYDLVAPASARITPLGLQVGTNRVINAEAKSAGVIVSGGIGSAEASSLIKIQWEDIIKTTKVNFDGSWTVLFESNLIPKDLVDSVVRVFVIDAAGNTSDSSTETVTIDTTAPTIPKIQVVTGDDLVNATEAKGGITMFGDAEPNTTVSLRWSSITRSATASNQGSWKIDIKASELATIDDGIQTVSLVASDLAGNQSKPLTKTFKLATKAAGAPELDLIAVDNKINLIEAKTGIKISGISEANSLISVNFGTNTIKTNADQSGSWNALFRSTSLPINDGSILVSATATNSSGLESTPATRSVILDRQAPILQEVSVIDNKLQLLFSEDLLIKSPAASCFRIVEDQNALNAIQSYISLSNPRMLELTLNRGPQSNAVVTVSYAAPANGSPLMDLSGNLAANFSNIKAASYGTTATVNSLSANYTTLKLLGVDPITGIGNQLDNIIIGNDSSNLLDGGEGADVLTGLGGADTFRYNNLKASLIAKYDWITDLSIGVDRIDGPFSISSADIRNAGTVTALTESNLQGILKSTIFKAKGACTFQYDKGNSTLTFLALNDTTPGFDAASDAIINITGYSGNLNSLTII